MKNTFLLREEFKEWLIKIGQFPLPTVNSYLSYVAGADKKLDISQEGIEGETNLFEILKTKVQNSDDFGMDNAIISVINVLQQENIQESLNTPLNTIRNWQSGLFQYREFLYDYINEQLELTDDAKTIQEDDAEQITITDYEAFDFFENDDNLLVIGDLDELDSNYTYSKTQLYKIFTFRIITQDRFYKEIFYPISFIKRFLYSKGERLFLDNWVEKLLDNIDVNLVDGKIKLQEIHSLDIVDKKVYVKHNSVQKLALTKLGDNENLVPFDINLLRKIAIDHEKPLLKIMLENKKDLPTFNEITSELKKYLRGTINPKKLKKANSKVLNSEYVNHLDVENLKRELEFLLAKTSLQLMDSKQNLLKKSYDRL